MAKHITRSALLCCFALLLVLMSLWLAVAPARSHVINESVWTGFLLQESDPIDNTTGIQSLFLKENGQRVVLNHMGAGIDIPISLISDRSAAVTIEVTVEEDFEEYLSAEVDRSIVLFENGGAETVYFTMVLLQSENLPDRMECSLQLTDENQHTLSADFVILPEGETDYYDPNGTMECPAWYETSVPFPVYTAGNALLRFSADGVRFGDFPPMTRYSDNGEDVLLYDGGAIKVSGNRLLQMDFSLISDGSFEDSFRLSTGLSSGTVGVLASSQLPALEGNSAAAVQGSETIPVFRNCVLPDVTMDVVVYALATENGRKQWISTELLSRTMNDGVYSVSTDGNSPGTYKIEATWTYREIELWTMSKTLFVSR